MSHDFIFARAKVRGLPHPSPLLHAGGVTSNFDYDIRDGMVTHLRLDEGASTIRIHVSGESHVTITGTAHRLELEVFSSDVDATELLISELRLDAEQSYVKASAAQLVSGIAGYASTLEVGPDTDTEGLRTPNAGKLIRTDR